MRFPGSEISGAFPSVFAKALDVSYSLPVQTLEGRASMLGSAPFWK
jgi:hypothetical protein